jgi:hypothetical protein
VNRPRGLCWTCYYEPGVKDQYPSDSKYARRGVGKESDGPEGELDIAPTAAEPGTPEKIAVMERRAAKGLSIFHPGDPRIEHGRQGPRRNEEPLRAVANADFAEFPAIERWSSNWSCSAWDRWKRFHPSRGSKVDVPDFYSRVPKAGKENLAFRHFLVSEAAADPAVQRALKAACKASLLFWVNAFAWTYDPRTRTKSLPFITYPFQDKALLEIDRRITEGGDLVIEKSRDMGASWMSLVVMEWRWHFHYGNTFLMLSRKEDLVDSRGDPDSLFWKIDFIHKHCPLWLMPRGWEPERHRTKLHFENPETGSTIDGDSSAKAASVGGRRTAVFLDEFSRMENAQAILAGSADVTNCRIFNFTPWGTANAAYKLAQRQDVWKVRMHWTQHPEKARGLYRWNTEKHRVEIKNPSERFKVKVKQGNREREVWFPEEWEFVRDGKWRSPWYDGECARRASPQDVAQNIDIDYRGSEYQFFDAATIESLKETYGREPYWEGDVSFDPDTARPAGLVKVAGGPLKLWLNPTPEAPAAGPLRRRGGHLLRDRGHPVLPLRRQRGDGREGGRVRHGGAAARAVRPAVRGAVLAVQGPGRHAGGLRVGDAGAGHHLRQEGDRTGLPQHLLRSNETRWPRGISDNPGWVPTTETKVRPPGGVPHGAGGPAVRQPLGQGAGRDAGVHLHRPGHDRARQPRGAGQRRRPRPDGQRGQPRRPGGGRRPDVEDGQGDGQADGHPKVETERPAQPQNDAVPADAAGAAEPA